MSCVCVCVVQKLVAIAEKMPLQAKKDPDRRAGRQMVATNILVAASLRHLGKGSDFEGGICRECFVSKTLLLKFHHAFMAELGGTDSVSGFYRANVSWPIEGSEEFRRSMEVYNALGLPGCIASVDGTHIPWERASADGRSWYVHSAVSSYDRTHSAVSSYDRTHSAVSSYDRTRSAVSSYDRAHSAVSSYDRTHSYRLGLPLHIVSLYDRTHSAVSPYDRTHSAVSLYDRTHSAVSPYDRTHSAVSSYDRTHSAVSSYDRTHSYRLGLPLHIVPLGASSSHHAGT